MTVKRMPQAFDHISAAIAICEEEDPKVDHSSLVARPKMGCVSAYQGILRERSKEKTPSILDFFFGKITLQYQLGRLPVLIRLLLHILFLQLPGNVIIFFFNFFRHCITLMSKIVINLNYIVYLFIYWLKACLKAKIHYNGCRVMLSYLTFIPIGKLVSNYTSSSGQHPSQKTQQQFILNSITK
jgi:hypothetical protein